MQQFRHLLFFEGKQLLTEEPASFLIEQKFSSAVRDIQDMSVFANQNQFKINVFEFRVRTSNVWIICLTHSS